MAQRRKSDNSQNHEQKDPSHIADHKVGDFFNQTLLQTASFHVLEVLAPSWENESIFRVLKRDQPRRIGARNEGFLNDFLMDALCTT